MTLFKNAPHLSPNIYYADLKLSVASFYVRSEFCSYYTHLVRVGGNDGMWSKAKAHPILDSVAPETKAIIYADYKWLWGLWQKEKGYHLPY